MDAKQLSEARLQVFYDEALVTNEREGGEFMKFLITGAGLGIGLELTQFALENGHEAIVLVRDPDKARQLAQLKKEYKDKLTIIKADVTSAEDLARARE